MIINEIPFHVFLERNPHIRTRPLNEQYVHYSDYLQSVHNQQYNIATYGGSLSDYLLQENGFTILQEDGSPILVTIK